MIGHSLTPSFEVDSEDLRLKKRLCISCEDTCSQAETKPERLSKSSEESYNGLINFFLSNLNEKSSFKEIRRVAKIAIEKGMTESDFTKQHLVLFALKKLETLHISIKMQTILFAAIEAFMLSRRISNLRSLGVFDKRVAENNNYCWLMNGARLAISAYYPDLNVYYLQCGRFGCDTSHINYIKNNLTKNEVLWLVVGYEDALHLSLMRVQMLNEKLNIHVFDSTGAEPQVTGKNYDSELSRIVSDIKEVVQPKKESFKFVSQERQVDSTNCFAFVLSDLKAALEYFAKGEKVFLNKEMKGSDDPWIRKCNNNVRKYKAYAPAFYKLAQNKNNLPKEIVATWETPVISGKANGNPEALRTGVRALATLIEKETILFRPQSYKEDGESEEDTEVRCYSTL